MRVLLSTTALLAVALLSGCIAAPFKAPTEGATANVRFVAEGVSRGKYHAKFFTFDTESCGNAQSVVQLGGLFGTKVGETIGMPAYGNRKRSEMTEVKARADAPLYVGIESGKAYAGYCYAVVKFTPANGHDYEVELTSDSQACYINAYELRQAPDGTVSRAQVEATQQTEDCKRWMVH